MKILKALASFGNGWKPYDPQWLVELAREQHQEKKWLAEAFSKCTSAQIGGRAYVYFVDYSNPNMPGSDWQFDQNLTLDHPDHGEIIVDVLKENKIGGIELLKELQ